MTKTLTPIELVAFGMRLATRDDTKLPDSVFRSQSIPSDDRRGVDIGASH